MIEYKKKETKKLIFYLLFGIDFCSFKQFPETMKKSFILLFAFFVFNGIFQVFCWVKKLKMREEKNINEKKIIITITERYIKLDIWKILHLRRIEKVEWHRSWPARTWNRWTFAIDTHTQTAFRSLRLEADRKTNLTKSKLLRAACVCAHISTRK